MKSHYSLVIIGSGFKARWMALKAYQKGAKDVALILTDFKEDSQTLCYHSLPPIVKIFPWDFITRASVAHGEVFTKDFRSFVVEEMLKLKVDIKQTLNLDCNTMRFFRYIDSLHELNEFRMHLKIVGNKLDFEFMDGFFEKHIGKFFEENEEAFIFDMHTAGIVVDELLKKNLISVLPLVSHLDSIRSDGRLIFKDNDSISFDSLVLMDADIIRKLYPSMKDVLVIYRDPYLEIDLPEESVFNAEQDFIGLSRYANNYFMKYKKKLYAGGFRYIESDFGMENFSTHISDKWEKHAIEQVEKIFDDLDLSKFLKQKCINYGCLPCDELPVVGPMFGEQGVYLMTGFAQLDLSLSLCFTKPLLDLILTGKSTIHRRFYPERHRSLNDPTN